MLSNFPALVSFWPQWSSHVHIQKMSFGEIPHSFRLTAINVIISRGRNGPFWGIFTAVVTIQSINLKLGCAQNICRCQHVHLWLLGGSEKWFSEAAHFVLKFASVMLQWKQKTQNVTCFVFEWLESDFCSQNKVESWATKFVSVRQDSYYEFLGSHNTGQMLVQLKGYQHRQTRL